MSNDDLREQIEALRSEVRRLNDSFVSLRDEDVRRVFAQQVRPVLVERIDRELGWPRAAGSGECRGALVEWTDAVLDAFERGGRSGGVRFLERNGAHGALRACGTPEADPLADELEALMRSYLDSYGSALRFPGAAPERGTEALSPEGVEAALGPLSNAIRITILQHLSRESEGLASLSRAVGLQKGHLQFHLRSLLGAGYIEYDRKSRLYLLSPRGRSALDGLARLMEVLGQ